VATDFLNMETIDPVDPPNPESPPQADDRCTACGFPTVMTISMSFEGTSVSVRVCLQCDERTWNRDGEQIRLDNLFDAMRRTSNRH
jgi:hypothetical protein